MMNSRVCQKPSLMGLSLRENFNKEMWNNRLPSRDKDVNKSRSSQAVKCKKGWCLGTFQACGDLNILALVQCFLLFPPNMFLCLLPTLNLKTCVLLLERVQNKHLCPCFRFCFKSMPISFPRAVKLRKFHLPILLFSLGSSKGTK